MLRISLMLINFVYCGIAVAQQQVKLVFDGPVEISKPTAEGLTDRQNIAGGTEFKFDTDKVYWVQAKGKVPMLVLPQMTSGKPEALRVQMPDVMTWPPNLVQQELDTKLSQLVSDLTAFQEALRKKDSAEAERALARMEQVGRLDYLHFLRATLKFVQGDIEAAKESTKRGLQRHPANAEGLKFLERLEGRR